MLVGTFAPDPWYLLRSRHRRKRQQTGSLNGSCCRSTVSPGLSLGWPIRHLGKLETQDYLFSSVTVSTLPGRYKNSCINTLFGRLPHWATPPFPCHSPGACASHDIGRYWPENGPSCALTPCIPRHHPRPDASPSGAHELLTHCSLPAPHSYSKQLNG